MLTVREACELIDDQLAAVAAEADDVRAAAEAARAAGWPRPLTVRELRVVALLCEGLTRAQIGERLGVAELTVKSHIARIGTVVGTGDQAGIVGVCFRAGVLR